MTRTPVRSSNLVSIGYSAANATLDVEFKHGVVYRYFAVPASVFDTLIATNRSGGSVGELFDRIVKKAGYRYDVL